MGNRKKRAAQKTAADSQGSLFSPEYSNPGTLRTLPTSKITSGLPYQRPVEEKVVDRLIAEWDDRLLDPLTISFRDGRFNLIDGQHRIAAARKKNGGRDVMMPCMVFSGLTYEQEAELCYKLDKAKRRLSLAQSTNALMESGTNEEINEIRRILQQEGFVWALNKRRAKAHEIAITEAVVHAYHDLGATLFARMLHLLEITWHGDAGCLNATMFAGMSLFIKTYGSILDDKAFAQRLSLFDPIEIVRRSKADFSTSNRGLRCAKVILEKYNSKRGGRKLDYLLHG